MLFMSCVFHALASVHCCLAVTRKERADLLALACDVCCDFNAFPFGLLGQVLCLILHGCLSYLYRCISRLTSS